MTTMNSDCTATTATTLPKGSRRPHRKFRERLLAGVAVAALIAGSAGIYSGHVFAAESLFSPNASAAARMLATPAAVPGFSDLVTAVKPAVVSVRVKAQGTSEASDTSEQGNPFEGTPFEKFFHGFPGAEGRRAPKFTQGQGSGFFVSADGYIVTNNHVVDHAVKVEIVTDGGATFEAKVIGTDPKTDLALIKIDGRKDFPFVRLAQSTAKIGDWVVAMGNPFGLGGTVTAGIVSAMGRDIGSGPYDDYIQIDAPVNRGNSGGPTFNLKGEVIGVNTAIFSPSGGSVGIAFDIPAATVASVIPQLQNSSHVARGWLGVQIQPVTKEIADSLGVKTASGALISEPQPGSPAAKAGLKSGDVIAMLDGKAVTDPRDLARRVSSLGPHKSVTLGIIRDGHDQTLQLTLGQMKDESIRKAAAEGAGKHQFGQLGLSVVPAAEVQGAGENGLAVVAVDPDGKAAELGLQPGDVILKAGNKPVSSPKDLTAAMDAAKASGRKNALMLFKRNNTEQFVAIPVAVG